MLKYNLALWLTHTFSLADNTESTSGLSLVCVCVLLRVCQCQSYLCAGLVLSLRARAALALHLSNRRHFIDVQGVHAGR